MIRSLLKRLFDRLGRHLPARDRRGKALVLAYHNIVPAGTVGWGDRSLHLAADAFARQLDVLTSELEVTTLDSIIRSTEQRIPRAAVTFDDAYLGAINLGVQACIDRNVPCTVFVAPALLGCIPHWDVAANANQWSEGDRQRFLLERRGYGQHSPSRQNDEVAHMLRIATEEEIRHSCTSPLVALACHTMHHPNLAALSTQECVNDIRSSNSWLRARFGEHARDLVAYPYGHAPLDPGVVLDQSGLSAGFVASGMWFDPDHCDRTRIPRWNIPSGISLDRFVLGVRGWYGNL